MNVSIGFNCSVWNSVIKFVCICTIWGESVFCHHPGHSTFKFVTSHRCKFRKVKNSFNSFRVFTVKNGHGTLISKGMDELSWLLACSHIFRKAKRYFKSYSMGMVKYGCGLLGHRALKFAESQDSIDESSWVFTCSWIVRNARSYFNSFWVHMVQYGRDLLGSLGL